MGHLIVGNRIQAVQVTYGSYVSGNSIRADAGTPSTAKLVIVTILPGVRVDTLYTGVGWPAGSIIKFMIHGIITGTVGSGGSGADDFFDANPLPDGAPGPGGAGGHALFIQDASAVIQIDNTDGYIFGGAGGGAGGTAASQFYPAAGLYVRPPGGGGAPNGTPGAGGDGNAQAGGNVTYPVWNGSSWSNLDGAVAIGGQGGTRSYYYGNNGCDAGGWGQSGGESRYYASDGNNYGRSGGLPGYAIKYANSSVSCTILAGNNGYQIRGSVGV